MSDSPSADERTIAVLVAAMQDMHQEIAGMVAELRGTVDEASEVSAELEDVGKGLASSVSQAAAQAVRSSLHGAVSETAEPARRQLLAALQPVIERFEQLERTANRLDARAHETVAWVSWRSLAVVAAAFGGLVLIAFSTLGRTGHEYGELVAQKAALEAEIIALQGHVDVLEKKGGRIRLADCGGRVCVAASPNQGKGTVSWRGFWTEKATGQVLVVPQGY
jgi:uncharacterized protein YukE